MPIESLFPSLNEALMPYFKYQTAKYILIEVPIVGIVHRLCQLGALVYVVLNMYGPMFVSDRPLANTSSLPRRASVRS